MSVSQKSVRYTSGVTIPDPCLLATLAIAFDSVILAPTPSRNASGKRVEELIRIGSRGGTLTVQSVISMTIHGDVEAMLGRFEQWDSAHRSLFDSRVLTRANAPGKGIANLEMHSDVSFLEPLLREADCLYRFRVEGEKAIAVPMGVLTHGLRDDIDAPSLFHVRKPAKHVPVLTSALAVSAFRYLLPRLPEMTVDQILEARDKVAATREGFLAHLQSMSDTVASGLQSDAGVRDVLAEAALAVQAKLVPDYWEFRRQLASEYAGRWKGVSESLEKLFEIDAAPWTPKFWGAVLKALGLSVLGDVDKQKEHLGNRAQAMNFLRQLDET